MAGKWVSKKKQAIGMFGTRKDGSREGDLLADNLTAPRYEAKKPKKVRTLSARKRSSPPKRKAQSLSARRRSPPKRKSRSSDSFKSVRSSSGRSSARSSSRSSGSSSGSGDQEEREEYILSLIHI